MAQKEGKEEESLDRDKKKWGVGSAGVRCHGRATPSAFPGVVASAAPVMLRIGKGHSL